MRKYSERAVSIARPEGIGQRAEGKGQRAKGKGRKSETPNAEFSQEIKS